MPAFDILPAQLMTEQAVHSLAWSLIHFLWQGCVIGLAVGFILWLCHALRPTTRYCVCLIGLLAMMVCPIVNLTCFDPVPVGWRIESNAPEATNAIVGYVAANPTGMPTVTDPKIGSTEYIELAESTHDVAGPPADLLPLNKFTFPNNVGVAGPNLKIAEDKAEITSSVAPTGLASSQFPRWIVGIWLVGVALCSLRLLLSWIGVWRLRNRTTAVPEFVVARTKQLAQVMKVTQPLIRSSERVTQAIAVGFLKPMILLPTSWLTELPPDMLESIIAHELAHIRRGDLWVNLLQRVIEVLLFYHPAVWWLSQRIRVERELCCDAIVVDITENPLRYAETLEHVGRLSVARTRSQPAESTLAVQSVGSRKVLLARIRSVLQVPDRQRVSTTWPAVAVALAVGCLISVSVLQSAPRMDMLTGSDKGGVMNTEEDFEEYAAELSYLDLKSVLYDRTDHYYRLADPKLKETHFRVLSQVTDPKYSIESLTELLTHDESKVRTLASVALFDRNDPKLLPHIVKLANDSAVTFPGHEKLSAFYLKRSGVGPPKKRQTVGDIASAMVKFYMGRVGIGYVIEHANEPDWSDYWNQRAKRSSCASWFYVKLARAGQGTSPTPPECVQKIRDLRKEIDKLNTNERVLTLLRLHSEYGGDVLVSEDELVKGCKEMGADELMLFLQHKPSVQDPDLQPRKRASWIDKPSVQFVLKHSPELLRSSDSEKLLECEKWERNYQQNGISDPNITSLWPIAAASLKPDQASKILHAALERFQLEREADDRAQLCTALIKLVGKSQLPQVVDWFYDEAPQRGQFPHCRAQLVQSMKNEALGKDLISQLVQDARFSKLDWQSLQSMLLVVNGWRDNPLVTHDELHHDVWHPLGMSHFHWEQEKAKQQYPKETKELNRHLNVWRDKLRSEFKSEVMTEREEETKVLAELDAIAKDVGKHEASDEQLSRIGELLDQIMKFESPDKMRVLKTLPNISRVVDGKELNEKLQRCFTFCRTMPGGNTQVLAELDAIAKDVGKHKPAEAQLSRISELLDQVMKFESPDKMRVLETLKRLSKAVRGKELNEKLQRCFAFYQRMPGGNIRRFETPVGEVMVSIRLEKPTIMLGEPTSLEFQIHNLSENDLFTVNQNSRNQYGRPESFHIIATGSDGQQVELLETGSIGSLNSWSQMPAGRRWKRKLFLPNWFLLNSPGEYTIHCRTKSVIGRSGEAVAEAFNFGQRDPATVEGASVIEVDLATTLTVEPVDETKMGQLVDSLGEAALAGRDEGDAAMKQLLAIDDPRTVPHFVKAVSMPNYSLRFQALQGLAKFDSDEALAGIEIGLATTDEDIGRASSSNIRHAAAGALSRSPHPKAESRLLSLLDDPNYAIRITAVHRLGKLKTAESLRLLKLKTMDLNSSVRGEAIRYSRERLASIDGDKTPNAEEINFLRDLVQDYQAAYDQSKKARNYSADGKSFAYHWLQTTQGRLAVAENRLADAVKHFQNAVDEADKNHQRKKEFYERHHAPSGSSKHTAPVSYAHSRLFFAQGELTVAKQKLEDSAKDKTSTPTQPDQKPDDPTAAVNPSALSSAGDLLSGRFVLSNKNAIDDLKPGNHEISPFRISKDGKTIGRRGGQWERWSEMGIPDESLVIGEDGGIANVVIWALLDVPDITIWNGPMPLSEVQAIDGRFQPHVLPFCNLTPLRLENKMPEGVDFHIQGFNAEHNLLLGPAGQARDGKITSKSKIRMEPERMPVSVRSNLFPWMKSYVLPLNHVCFAVTDKTGRFKIKHLPHAETEFAIWHEKVGWLKTKRFPTGRFKFNVVPGENTIGEVKVDPEIFKEALNEKAAPRKPVIDVVEREGDAMIVYFNHVGDGLKSSDGQPLRHFEVCGVDKVFHPASAKIISKNIVSISSPNVAEPNGVRFAWSLPPNTPVNLVDSAGQRANPFAIPDHLATKARKAKNAQVSRDIIDEFAKTLEPQLPKGWSTVVVSRFLVIERDNKTNAVPRYGRRPRFADETEAEYLKDIETEYKKDMNPITLDVKLRFAPRLSDKNWLGLSANLADLMESGKNGFKDKTALREHARLVARYQLPSYENSEYSIFESQGVNQFYVEITDDQAKQELDNVLALLKKTLPANRGTSAVADKPEVRWPYVWIDTLPTASHEVNTSKAQSLTTEQALEQFNGDPSSGFLNPGWAQTIDWKDVPDFEAWIKSKPELAELARKSRQAEPYVRIVRFSKRQVEVKICRSVGLCMGRQYYAVAKHFRIPRSPEVDAALGLAEIEAIHVTTYQGIGKGDDQTQVFEKLGKPDKTRGLQTGDSYHYYVDENVTLFYRHRNVHTVTLDVPDEIKEQH